MSKIEHLLYEFDSVFDVFLEFCIIFVCIGIFIGRWLKGEK